MQIDQNLNPEIEIKSKPKRLVNISGFEKSLEPMCRVYLSSSSSPSAECIKLMFFSLSLQFHHVYRETEDSAGDFLHHKQLWLYQISLKRIEILL
jgi:hypothetical protein